MTNTHGWNTTEILRQKLNLEDSLIDEKGKEEFLTKTDDFHDIFSLRNEIGTCPFIEVHLKIKDETPFFVWPYPMWEEQKKVIQKEMDRLGHLGIIRKGLTSYSSLVVLEKEPKPILSLQWFLDTKWKITQNKSYIHVRL